MTQRSLTKALGTLLFGICFVGACFVSAGPTAETPLNQPEKEQNKIMKKYTQKPLGYGFGDLEPAMARETVELHYGKHHAAYVANLNAALEKVPDFSAPESPFQLLRQLDSVPAEVRTAVRNNGGGFVNHEIFWEELSPQGGGVPVGALAEAIDKAFGSFDAFKEKFAAASMAHFGAGWTWLILRKDGSLKITTLPNQDNPVMPESIVPAESQGIPILALDLWEHAYYLQYQNRKAEYVKSFWQLVNWEDVNKFYTKIRERVPAAQGASGCGCSAQ